MEGKLPQAGDTVLHPFLGAPDEQTSQLLLARLLFEQADPVSRKVIYHVLPVSDIDDREDLIQEVRFKVTERLSRFKDKSQSNPILSFTGYVAAVARNVVNDYLRRKYRRRFSLQKQLRYLLLTQPEFAVWIQAGRFKETVCGFAVWQHQPRHTLSSEQQRVALDNPHSFMNAALSGADINSLNPAALLASLFNQLGHPLTLDDLVSIFAQIWGIKDHLEGGVMEEEVIAASLECLADHQATPAAEVEARIMLRHLLKEIHQLPRNQRSALLLNLDEIHAFPMTGTASVREIAATLEMPANELARLWPDLPLNDRAIAMLLGITQRQVINQRKIARERLWRRRMNLGEPTVGPNLP